MDIVEKLVAARARWIAGEGASRELRPRRYDVGDEVVFARIAESARGATPVVFVHGIGVSGLYMLPTAMQVARANPVYVPDLPGIGNSPSDSPPLTLDEFADVLARFVEVAGLEAPTLVGNSYGCQIAARCALRHPGVASRLVLQSPTIDSSARTGPAQIWRWVLNGLHEPFSEAGVVFRDYLRAGTRQIAASLRNALDEPIEDDLRQLDLPVLLVRGASDPISPQDWLEHLARVCPAARVFTVERAAHTVNYSAPRVFAKAIGEFTNGVAT